MFAQTYTASPSGWTSQPSSSVSWNTNGQTYRATTDDKNTWIEARAVVNNTSKTISFSFRKNSGTFKNSISGRLIKDINTSNEENLKGVSASAGSSASTNYEITPNFTSGSHTYIFLLKSNGINFCTVPITIKASSSSQVNLSLASTGSFGTTTLTKGKEYTYTVKAKNNGSSTWSGAFYLKSGNTNWITWSKSISAGGTLTLTGTYTPTTTGSHTLKLYYQTGGSGEGVLVPAGSYSNAVSVSVTDAVNLSLASTGSFGTTTLTKGKEYTYTVKVKNNSSSSWSGAFYLKSGDTNWITWSKSISAGGTLTLTGTYTPTTTGSHTLKLYYQTGGSGEGFLVPAGSYSNAVSVTVAEAANLVLASTGSFGTTTLTKGKEYTYSVKVKNNGSSSWSGAFYLKSGSVDWIKCSKTINAGSTITITCTYTPTTTGSHTLKLYYQTGGSGEGFLVPAGSYSNAVSVTVVEAANLSLASTGSFGTTTLTKGKEYTYTVKVKNNGSSTWSGAFYLKSGDTNWISWSKSISAGGTVTLTGTYTPTTAGSHTLKLYYQTGGSGDGFLVPAGSYSNSVSVTVAESVSSDSYTVSPTGYTSVPPSNVTQGTRTLHGGLLQVKASVSGKIATFTLKKNDGSQFKNKGNLVVYAGGYNGDVVKSNVSYAAGIYNPTVDVNLDFTSGSRKYVIVIKSGDSFYYTDPITIAAKGSTSDVDLVISGGSYFNTNILTTGKEQTFSIKIKNNGSTAWNGSFFLKCGKENWLEWYDQTINAGSTKTLTPKSYVPTSAGKKTLILYYQTGGSGDGIEVSAGSYDNPFTVTVADPPSTDKLATPDKNTFKATNPTETGFTASWGAVSGATSYNINVRKVGGDYANPVFKDATSKTYIEVNGLTPGTSYEFQIQARNGNASQNSDWSASIPTAVTTKKAGTEPASLSIYSIAGFDGSKSLIVGKTYHYNVLVQNTGTSRWKGSFYLKDGDSDLNPWHDISLGSGVAQRLEYDYTPESTGSKSLTLYYQTNTSGGGLPVNAGNAKNPMTVKVIADPSVYDGLKLKSAITYPSTLELGKKGTIAAEVQNTGDKEWKGTLYLTDNGVTIAYKEDLSKGQTKTLYATTWEPQTTGTHSIAVKYESENSNSQQLVDANGFVNPVSVVVSNADVLGDASLVYIKHITSEVEPSEVTPGTIVCYHYRLLDDKGKQLRDMKLRFKYTQGNQTKYIESEPSDQEGYAVLLIATSGSAAIAGRGETVNLECIQAINEYGKAIPIKANIDSDRNLSLTIHQGTQFSRESGSENIERVKVTITPGVTAKMEWNMLSEHAKAKASLGFPIGVGIKWDDYGNVKDYSLDLGVKLSGSIGSKDNNELAKWESYIPNIQGKGSVGYKLNFTTSSPKEAFSSFVKAWVDNYNESTDWKTDLAVKAMRHWYESKQDLGITQSWYYSIGASVSGDVFKSWPGSKEIKEAVWPALTIKELKLGANGNITIEPWKNKIIISEGKSKVLEGYSSALKIGGEFGFKGKIHDLVNLAQCHMKGWSLLDAYNKEMLSDEFFYESTSLNYSKDFSMKHEEMYNKTSSALEEVSQQISLSSSWDWSAENIHIGDILVDGWKPFDIGLGYTSKYTQKVSSKGGWANFLRKQIVSNSEYSNMVLKVFPNLSYKSLITPPYEIYNTWQNDFDQSLSSLARVTPNPNNYNLKDALKFERTVSSEFDASVSIKVYDWGWCKFYIDTDINLEVENKSNESYFSVPDRRTFDVVLRPNTSIKKIAGYAVQHTANKIWETFEEEHPNIVAAWDWIKQTYGLVVDEYGNLVEWVDNQIGDFVEDNIFYPFFYHWYMHDRYNVNARRAMSKHPILAEKEQVDICMFTLGINNENVRNFDSGVKIEVPHYYPAGDLLGITDQGDTLFVVSEVIDLIAIQGSDTLKTTQYGQFSLEGISGADDLTPFGFPEDTPLDVYYSEEGSDIWHYVGPTGTTIKTDKLGAYMMGTSIKNDAVSPEIIADLDEQSGILHLKVNENIGLRVNSLNVLVNGIKKKATAINESSFEIYLTESEAKYMLTLYVTINDLAGNQGRLFQVFNIGKEDPDDIKSTESEKNKAEILLSKNTLKVEGAEPETTVMLFSLKGDIIANEKTDESGKAQVRLSHLPAGVYVVTLSNGKTKKFLIK